ncbi:MAG TPA: amidohydrolase family protein [Pyrinomonadaceae bacterium]
MKAVRLSALLVLSLLPIPILCQTKQNADPYSLVFTHANVIDMTGAPVRRDVTVVITGDRIAAIGSERELKIPNNSEVVDARGKFLIPGLWDMHVHTLTKEMFFPLYLANGVTGVRDMYNPLAKFDDWRREIDEGKILGPRLVASQTLVDGPKPVWPLSIAVSNEAQGREAVLSLKKRGADFIKVYSLLPRDAYFAIADEAKKQGIPFAGHVPVAVSALEASDAGQKSIEHLTGVLLASSAREDELRAAALRALADGRSLLIESFFKSEVEALKSFDEKKARTLFARFARNGTWHVPTLTVLNAFWTFDDPTTLNDPRLKYIPPFIRLALGWDPKRAFGFKIRTAADVAEGKRLFRRQLELVGAMHRAGVRVMAGTDTPNPFVFPGFSLHDELALLVRAGLTPLEALQSATRNPAEYLNRLDSFGTLEKGKVADLVLLEADPLADISNTKRIAAVVRSGKLLTKAQLQEMLATVEAAAGRR